MCVGLFVVVVVVLGGEWVERILDPHTHKKNEQKAIFYYSETCL